MDRISDTNVPDGFRVIEPRKIPQVYLLRQLRIVASHRALRGMVRDIRNHGAGKWMVRSVNRVVGNTTYTHTVRILYRPINRPGTWECIYGITSDREIHLWMD